MTSSKIFNICDYGALSGHQSDSTVAIQSAIDDASACGGRVVIPAGDWESGALMLRSNLTFYMEKGATLGCSVAVPPRYAMWRSSITAISITMELISIVAKAWKFAIAGPGGLDAYGFHLRYVQGLSMENVIVEPGVGETRPMAVRESIR